MEMSVSSETTFFSTKLQPEIYVLQSSAEDRGGIDTSNFHFAQQVHPPFSLKECNQKVLFETMLHQYSTLQCQPDTSCRARACSKVSHKSSGDNGKRWEARKKKKMCTA